MLDKPINPVKLATFASYLGLDEQEARDLLKEVLLKKHLDRAGEPHRVVAVPCENEHAGQGGESRCGTQAAKGASPATADGGPTVASPTHTCGGIGPSVCCAGCNHELAMTLVSDRTYDNTPKPKRGRRANAAPYVPDPSQKPPITEYRGWHLRRVVKSIMPDEEVKRLVDEWEAIPVEDAGKSQDTHNMACQLFDALEAAGWDREA